MHVLQKIEEDHFAIDVIGGHPVIITNAEILGEAGSEWEGYPIFSKDYLIDLLAIGLVYQVLTVADLQRAKDKATILKIRQQQEKPESPPYTF
ncbi:hypothetical protein HZU77_002970 [Neisseriaceae bacterium TC5R-5]|nr:hypothetical protein [Neisseriaceae bacterium TC5R-5]